MVTTRTADAQREQTTSAAVRLAARVGWSSMVTFVLLLILGGALTDGYSHVTQKISELGATGAPYAALQNLNFVILGVGVLSFAWALYQTSSSSTLLPSLLIGFFGVVAVAHAFISCDVGCKGETPMGLLHNVTGLIGFVAVIAGMLVVAKQWSAVPALRSRVRLTRVLAVVAICGLVTFVATQALDVQSFAGIAQRVFAGSFILWIGSTSARLARWQNPSAN